MTGKAALHGERHVMTYTTPYSYTNAHNKCQAITTHLAINLYSGHQTEASNQLRLSSPLAYNPNKASLLTE